MSKPTLSFLPVAACETDADTGHFCNRLDARRGRCAYLGERLFCARGLYRRHPNCPHGMVPLVVDATDAAPPPRDREAN